MTNPQPICVIQTIIVPFYFTVLAIETRLGKTYPNLRIGSSRFGYLLVYMLDSENLNPYEYNLK